MRRLLPSGAVLAVLVGWVSMDPSVVDPGAFLGDRRAPPGFHDQAAPPTLLPVLDVRIVPIHALLLVGFADDPVYAAVELQLRPGPEGGEGAPGPPGAGG